MSAGEQEIERDEGEGWHGAEVLTAYTCCIDLALTFYGACHTRTTCELCHYSHSRSRSYTRSNSRSHSNDNDNSELEFHTAEEYAEHLDNLLL